MGHALSSGQLALTWIEREQPNMLHFKIHGLLEPQHTLVGASSNSFHFGNPNGSWDPPYLHVIPMVFWGPSNRLFEQQWFLQLLEIHCLKNYMVLWPMALSFWISK
jgi:hypothetical protein